MSFKRFFAAALSLLLIFALAACNETPAGEEYVEVVTSVDPATVFTERDTRASYDEATAIKINLADGAITAPGLAVQGNTVFITAEGVYEITGTLSDGQIRVAADDLAKVQLVFKGASITSGNSAAILIESADKVFLTFVAGTENALRNNGNFVSNDGVDGAIFSRSDMTINGTGKLTVSTEYGNGIVCKDDLVIAGTDITLSTARRGIDANDSLRVESGKLSITSGKDAIHVENIEDTARGNIYIKNVNLTVQSAEDGMTATGWIEVLDGSFTVTAGGGAASGGMDKFEAIKAEKTILLKNGTYTLNANGDTIRAAGNLQIDNGSFTLTSGDDAVQAGGRAQFNGSNLKQQ